MSVVSCPVLFCRVDTIRHDTVYWLIVDVDVDDDDDDDDSTFHVSFAFVI